MKKKRVLFLIESFIVGGAERVLIDIVNNLDASKYDITVCSVYKHSVYKGYNKTFDNPFKTHIRYKYIINNHIGWLYILFNYLINKIPNLLYKILIGDQYETAIAFYEGFPTYWIANAKLKRGKKVAWLHTTTELSQANKKDNDIIKENYIYNKYNKIVAVSHSVANSFIKTFPSQNKKISIIYNPIDIESIKQKSAILLNNHKECFTFISVGRITPVKGYNRIIKAAYELNKKGYKFQWWIVGGGDITKLITELKKFNILQIFTFWGHQDNPYPFIKNADCFVSASYTEGLGLALIESLVIGTLVISSNYGAAIEILGENEYGLLFEQDEKSFISILEKTLRHKEEYSHYIEKGKKRATYFSFNNQINNIENIL